MYTQVDYSFIRLRHGSHIIWLNQSVYYVHKDELEKNIWNLGDSLAAFLGDSFECHAWWYSDLENIEKYL